MKTHLLGGSIYYYVVHNYYVQHKYCTEIAIESNMELQLAKTTIIMYCIILHDYLDKLSRLKNVHL